MDTRIDLVRELYSGNKKQSSVPKVDFDFDDLAVSTGLGAGVGLAVGGVAGAVVGGVWGALGYIGGYLAGTTATTLGTDEKQTEVVRRLTELLMPMNFGAKVKTGQSLLKMVFSKAPKPVIEGTKYATFGLSMGYIAEPYVFEDPETGTYKMLGLAGLSGVGLYYAKKFAPAVVWSAYSIRQIVSEVSDGTKGAGVLVEEAWKPSVLKKVFGRDIEIPKLKWENGQLVVKAKDIFGEALMESRYQVAELMQELEDVAGIFDKYGIKIGTRESRRLGEILWNPLDDFETGRQLNEFIEQELGLMGAQKEELLGAIQNLRKVSKLMADRLAVYGGVGQKYLSLLGGSRVFQHVFSIPSVEVWKKSMLELKDLQFSRGTDVVPSIRTAYRRGEIKDGNNKSFMKILGRTPKEGDAIIDNNGKVWTYVRIQEDKSPVWFRDWDLEEVLDVSKLTKGKPIQFLDITASVYSQISEDLKLIRRLHFLDFIKKVGEETGRISSRPVDGYIPLTQKKGDKIIKTWGTLTDKYIAPDLYRHINAFLSMEKYKPPSSKLATMNRIWKSFLLSLNFKSYINAFLGNLALAEVNGFGADDVLYEYFRSIGKQDNLFKEAQRHGIVGKTFIIESGMVEDAKVLEEKLKPQYQKNKVMEKVDRIVNSVDTLLSRGVQKWYGKVDEMFRYGLYRKLRQQGLDERQASRIALESFAYYGDMPVFVRQIRDTIMPFVSFQVRIFPQLLKGFLKYPERYASVFALMEGLQRYALMQAYGEENWLEGAKYEEIVRPAYMEMRPAGILADFIRVPQLIDDEGNTIVPSGYMYSGFMPWNIPISIPHISGFQAYDNPASTYLATILIQNPLMRFISGVMLGVDPSTGRRILETAGVDRPLASILQYGMQTIMPSFSTIKYPLQIFAREGWLDPVISWFNYYGTYPDGEPVGTAHMIWNAVSPSVLKFDPDYNLQMSLKRLEALQRGYEMQFKKAVRRQASPSVLESNWERLQNAYGEIYEKKAEIVERWNRIR